MKYWVTATLGLMLASNSMAQSYRVEIELAKFSSAEYHRPYVAVWIASPSNQPQQVLQLWSERDRWLKDLKYFWRRVLRKDPGASDGATGATRGPGRYHFSWDGEAGKTRLPSGSYKLCAEAAREHGGHSAKCLNFDLPLTMVQQIQLNGEIIQLRIEAE